MEKVSSNYSVFGNWEIINVGLSSSTGFIRLQKLQGISQIFTWSNPIKLEQSYGHLPLVNFLQTCRNFSLGYLPYHLHIANLKLHCRRIEHEWFHCSCQNRWYKNIRSCAQKKSLGLDEALCLFVAFINKNPQKEHSVVWILSASNLPQRLKFL